MSSNTLKLLILFFFLLKLKLVFCDNNIINQSTLNSMELYVLRDHIMQDLTTLNMSTTDNGSNRNNNVNVTAFCASVNNLSFSNRTNSPYINYVATKVFKDNDLCLIFCSASLNKLLWNNCSVIKNLTEEKSNVSNSAESPSDHKLKKQDNSVPEVSSNDVVRSQLPNAKSSADKNINVPIPINIPPEKLKNSIPENETLLKEVNNSLVKPVVVDNSAEKTVSSNTFPNPDNIDEVNEETHYFFYFVVVSILCIVFYIAMYNKKKILALMIEGRKYKDKRRPTSAGYRKLNTNLEEVMPLGNSPPSMDSLIY